MLYTIYGLHEAGKPDEIQYIGMTSQTPKRRLQGHASSDCPVGAWITFLSISEKQVQCRVLAQTEDANFAALLEKQLIADFVRGGYCLLNVRHNGKRQVNAEEKAARQKYIQALKEQRELATSAKVDHLFSQLREEIESGRLNVQSILSGQNEQA